MASSVRVFRLSVSCDYDSCYEWSREKEQLNLFGTIPQSNCLVQSETVQKQSPGGALCLRPATLLKKVSGTGVFLWILRISKNTFSPRTPPGVASDSSLLFYY